ncbi:MAG: endonuclease III domain-containing protein [Methanomicrobiales archaeon]|nr:endonuclease III domain-containing protein [Methanomicrobiales archaeon]
MHPLERIYAHLFSMYGPQGWWPLRYAGESPAASRGAGGYHPGRYDLPVSTGGIFEICTGAILTQNTAWTNVEKALDNLAALGAITAEQILLLDDESLRAAIRPAGYYNQKSKKLKAFSRFFIDLDGRTPTRNELLAVWGIGKETADSILLYAYQVPVFIVDAYTRRIMTRCQLIGERWEYDRVRGYIEAHIPPDYRIYQEYHALLVHHAKRHYRRNAPSHSCPLGMLLAGDA